MEESELAQLCTVAVYVCSLDRELLYSDGCVDKIDWICRKFCFIPNFIKSNCLIDVMQTRRSGGIAEHSDLQICISLDFFYSQRSIYRIRASLFKFIVCFYDRIILYYRMIYNTTSHIIIHHLSLSLLISLFINSSPTCSLSLLPSLSLSFYSRMWCIG